MPQRSCLSRHSDRGCRAAVLLLALVLSLGLTGCSTFMSYNSQGDNMRSALLSCHPGDAADQAGTMANKRAGGPDGLLWRLEQGALLRAAGNYAASNNAFSTAEEVIADYDARATVSAREVGSEGLAALTNLNALPYRGAPYDRIMLNTYKAMNYLNLGKFEAAQVELRRAYLRQQEAVNQRQKEITAGDAASNDAQARQVASQPGVSNELDRRYSALNQLSGYADFVNPVTVLLDGIVFLHTGTDASDIDRARLDFERLAAMLGRHPDFTAALADAQALAGGRQPSPVLYVLLENGLAPIRQEFRLDLPVPAKEVIYVGAAFPELVFQPTALSGLTVSAGGHPLGTTHSVASMDSIVAAEMRAQLPSITARTIGLAVVRGVAQYQARREGGELAQLGVALFNMVMNSADLRTWQSLPKEFQFVRLPHPGPGTLQLRGRSGSDLVEVQIPPGTATLVLAKASVAGCLSAQVVNLR